MTDFTPALGADGTEGHNAAPASIERAARRVSSGTVSAVQVAILGNLAVQRDYGATCHEAEAFTGVSHESYTGARTNLHRRGDVARLAEQRDRRHVYVLPEHIHGRDTVPYKANRPREPERLPEPVARAVEAIEAWAIETEGLGLLVSPPNYSDLNTIITHLKGRQ